jgi:flagellar biosynthesis/type III secretory pathway protein FliH
MTLKSIAIGTSIALAALAFSGCASTQEEMVQKGYPKAYAQGYADGCTSGKQAGGSMFDEFKKNPTRYSSDKQYKSGWDDGFRQCEKKEEAIEKSVQNAQRTAVEQKIERDLAKKQ